MDSSVSPKDEIWFLRVCHHISTGLYSKCFGPRMRLANVCVAGRPDLTVEAPDHSLSSTNHLPTPVDLTKEVRAISSVISAVRCR
jgi:hypothetical protein